MAINKVIYGGNTLIDITDTTATASTILSGYGAYGADGSWIDGTATSSSGSGSEVEVTEVANDTGTTCVITSSSMYQDYALSIVYGVSGMDAASSYDVETDYNSATTAVGGE